MLDEAYHDQHKLGKTPKHSVRYFAPIAEDLFKKRYDQKIFNQDSLNREDRLEPVYDKEVGGKDQALTKTAENVLRKLPEGETHLIVTGLVKDNQLTESFSSWDMPVLIRGEQIPVDRIFEVKKEGEKLLINDASSRFLNH